MLEVLLTAVPALCWLLCRVVQLLQQPLETLFQKLNIDIPHSPQVTVDCLGRNDVVLHWDLESAPDENIYYVVLVNGREAATLAGRSIKVCGLELGKMYQLRVLAVNATSNFRAQSMAIFVTTKGLLEGVEWEMRSTLVNKTEGGEVAKDLIAVEEVEKIEDFGILHNQLVAYQLELQRVIADMAAFNGSQQAEMLELAKSYDEYKEMLSEEHEIRGKKDLDVKTLEKKKDTLTFEKLKLSKQLRNQHSHKTIHESSLAELKSRVAKLEEKKHHVLNTASLEKSRVDAQVDRLHGEIAELKSQLISLESQSKQLNIEKKELAHVASNLRPLVEQFTVFNSQPAAPGGDLSPNGSLTSLNSASFEVFTRDSLLTKGGAELLRKLTVLRPEWEAEINKEFELLTSLELLWKSAYRAAIRKFVLLHNSVEQARAAANPGYQPQKLTEYQASVEFGGFSNALSKPRIPKVYTFVDENSSPAVESPRSGAVSPPPEKATTPLYGRVYENLHDNNLGSLGIDSANITNKDFSEIHPSNRDTFDQNPVNREYQMSQSNSLNVPLMSSTSSIGRNYNGGMSQAALSQASLGGQNSLNPHYNVPLEPTASGSLIHASFLGNQLNTSDSLQGFLFPLQPSLLQGMQQDTHNLQHPLQDSLHGGLNQQSNMQQMPYLSNLSYDDQMYGRSPTPDNPPYAQLQVSSMWNTHGNTGGSGTNASTSSYMGNMHYPKQLSLSPRPGAVELSPSLSILPPQTELLDSLMLSNPQLQPSALSSNLSLNIWLDRLGAGLGGHNRALSGGNHIWRHDVQSGGMAPDFQPFNVDKKREPDADDIQLL